MPASCWQHLERAKHSALTPRSANLPRLALSRAARAASDCFTISTTFGHCSNHMDIQRKAARCSTNSDKSSASSNVAKATRDSEHATSSVRQLVQQKYRAHTHTQGKTARQLAIHAKASCGPPTYHMDTWRCQLSLLRLLGTKADTSSAMPATSLLESGPAGFPCRALRTRPNLPDNLARL